MKVCVEVGMIVSLQQDEALIYELYSVLAGISLP